MLQHPPATSLPHRDFGSNLPDTCLLPAGQQLFTLPSTTTYEPCRPRRRPRRQPRFPRAKQRSQKHDQPRRASPQQRRHRDVHPQPRRCRHRTVCAPRNCRPSRRVMSKTRDKMNHNRHSRVHGNATHRMENVRQLPCFHADRDGNLQP